MEMDASFVATLATKADLKPLATKEELAAVAPLPTREERHDAILTEGIETRRYFDIVAERLLHLRAELKADIANLDRRVTRLESRRS